MHRRILSSLGVILLEQLITLSLSTVLLGALSAFYLILMQQVAQMAALNNMNGNFVVASQLIQRELNLAGYLGCPNLRNTSISSYNQDYLFNNANKIAIINYPTLQITSKHRSIAAATLSIDMQNYHDLLVSGNLKFKPGSIIMITDCHDATIALVKEVINYHDHQHLKLHQPLNTKYRKNTEVGMLESNTYYIEHNTLYRADIYHKHTALVTGINKITATLYNTPQQIIAGINITWHLNSGGINSIRYQFMHV